MSIPNHRAPYLAVCIRDPRNELVGPECENLTAGRPDSFGVARCQSIELVPAACYIRYGLKWIAEGSTLDDLVCQVQSTRLEADGFRIELVRLSKRLKIDRWEAMRVVADAIPSDANMKSPKCRFLILARENWWCLGEIITEQTHSYRIHDQKPYRTSSSLPSQLARALINLVVPGAKTIVDPCSGVGSVLLEACALNVACSGGDFNRRMVGMSRKNMQHFAYEASISYADARELSTEADAVITDLPYGMKSMISESDVRRILDRSILCAPTALFVAGSDISSWLISAGYRRVKVYRVPKQTGFMRYVHRAERN